jgi:two-component system, sensor histidine kinase
MSTAADPARGNILVVDDEPLNLQAMEALLSAADCQVITAASGQEALRWILRMDFALVLLDVRMPDMDGFETAALIRKLKRSRYTPIVFLTAAGEQVEWVHRGYEAGAVDYIVKPVDPEVLKSKVAIFVDLNSRSAGLATQVARQRSVQRELLKTRDDLEIKIRERTADLIAAHDTLRREIEQRERAEAELRVAKRIAEEANRAKSEFLANMSHEIRTPMNAVIGLTDVALGTELSAQQRECLELVRASGESLLAIVNDILDVSRIEAGRLVVEQIPFRLRDTIDDALRTVAVEAERKGLELSWEIAPQIPETLLGDPMRLRQILLNLAGNAIKFTERGGVAVQVRPEASPGGGIRCHFSVADSGIGIAAEKQALIFAPFQQADASTSRRYGGTGLGLTISARLVELMHGRIWLESIAGEGSTFHFTLRFGMADEAHSRGAARAAAGLAAAAVRERGAPRLTVLLVEDNAVNRRLAEIVLSGHGHTVVAVENGCAALEALHRLRFDLILMDVQMPGMDGIATTRAIREAEGAAGGHVPILALTAHALAGDRQRCLGAGMDGYLEKPVRPVALLEAVERLAHRPAADIAAAERGTAAPERTTLLEQVGGDSRLLEEICELFARESGRHMAAVRAAIERGEPQALASALHTLRGMLRSVGSTAADQYAALLETLDPLEQRAEALAAWERLEQGLDEERARLGAFDAAARLERSATARSGG